MSKKVRYVCFKCGHKQRYKIECLGCGVMAVWLDPIEKKVRPFGQRGNGFHRPKTVLSDAEKARREEMKPWLGVDLDAPDFESLLKENRKKVRPTVTQ